MNTGDFNRLMELGGSACWICSKFPVKRALDIDHVHNSSPVLVRGLLCSRCNVGLGLLQSSNVLLEKLAVYLEGHKKLDVGWFKQYRKQGVEEAVVTPTAKRVRNRKLEKPRSKFSSLAPEGTHGCSVCCKYLPISEFSYGMASNGKSYPSSYCRSCHRNWSRERDKLKPRTPEILRSTQLNVKFDITLEDYEYLMSLQDGFCAGCGGLNAQGERLAVDHDHTRGKSAVRGLLCRNCNIGLGAFNDSPEILRSAIQYLKSSEDKSGKWWGPAVDPETEALKEKNERIQQARIDFSEGRKTRADISKEFNMNAQSAGEMLTGKSYSSAGGPLVNNPSESTPGWSSRERGDSHWTRRMPGKLLRGDAHPMRRRAKSSVVPVDTVTVPH